MSHPPCCKCGRTHEPISLSDIQWGTATGGGCVGRPSRRREIPRSELFAIFERHGLWLRDLPGGKRANLSHACLGGMDLSGVELSRSILVGADLSDSNLYRARLRDADLSFADLRMAYLKEADIRYADFKMANLAQATLPTDWPIVRMDLDGYDVTINPAATSIGDEHWRNTIWLKWHKGQSTIREDSEKFATWWERHGDLVQAAIRSILPAEKPSTPTGDTPNGP